MSCQTHSDLWIQQGMMTHRMTHDPTSSYTLDQSQDMDNNHRSQNRTIALNGSLLVTTPERIYPYRSWITAIRSSTLMMS